MEFGFDVAGALKSVSQSVQQQDVAIVHGDKFRGASPQVMDQVRQVIDSMGQASGKAQKLPSTITTLGKLQANGHILFMKAQGNRCIGFLKVGYKKLFVRGRGGEMNEMKPLSVLDFYVDSSVQRGGIGRALFDIMLAYMDSKPALIAYDRPSHKLMGFLAKHFGLSNYVQQNNNYVVFDDYYNTDATGKSAPNAANNNSNSASSPQNDRVQQLSPKKQHEPLVRQSTMNSNFNKENAPHSVFGQSHMSSFQPGVTQNKGAGSQGQTQHAPYSQSQHQTMNGGGWGSQAASMNQETKTHYPRQSHHNQTFRIGGDYQHANTAKRNGEKGPSEQAHTRTQAHTFGHNSNSATSNMFEQTHSSNGFGSTFLSSSNQASLRHSQQQMPMRMQQLKTSTQMKFGNVGQELLGGPQSSQAAQPNNHLHDFKQSFNKLSFQRQQEKPDDSQMFQTSYQSQFHQDGNNGGNGVELAPSGGGANHTRGQQGYSHFMAFANRQQSLPSPPGQNAQNNGQHHQLVNRQQAQQPDFRTLQGNTMRPQRQQYAATFQNTGQMPIMPQQNEHLNLTPNGGHSKAFSMPATQRLLANNNQRSNTQHLPNHHNSHLSPALGSRAAQFLQHQHQFSGVLQKPTFSNNQTAMGQIWQSHDQLDAFKARPAAQQYRHY